MRQMDLTRFDLVDLDTSECDVCHQVTREELVHCPECLENSPSTTDKTPHTNSRGHRECFERWHDILRRSTPSPHRSPVPKAAVSARPEQSTYSEVKDFVSTALRWFKNDAQKSNTTMPSLPISRYENVAMPKYCSKRMDTRNKFLAQLQGLPVYKDNTLLNLVKKKKAPRPQFYVGESEEEERREIYNELRRNSESSSSSEDEEDICVYEKVTVPKRPERSESRTSGPLDFCIQLPITKDQLKNLNREQLEACVAFLRMRIDDTSGDLVSTLQVRDWTLNQISVKHTVIYQLHKAQDRMPHLRPSSPNSRHIPPVNQSSQLTNHGIFRAERLMNTKA